MPERIRWGILGTGAIARKFAAALRALPGAYLAAIGSRTRSKAAQFGEQFAIPERHASYEALLNDPAVDAVYVATPHSCHEDNALAALAANKPVLVEKPFTINARGAEAVIRAARGKGLLVMEAMWTRFIPLHTQLRQMLASGVIGHVRSLRADFGFMAGPQANPRLFDPALGGGALLDIGVYPVSLASMIFGKPSQITGRAKIGPAGVDEQSEMLLNYPRGRHAALSCSLLANTSNEALIEGAAGRIRIHPPFFMSDAMTLARDGHTEELLRFPFEGNGYQFEAIEFMNCLRARKTESQIMPLEETLGIMKTLDALRAQWGVRYPMEP